MATTYEINDAGIAEVVMDHPPVNALTVAGWFELADRSCARSATIPPCGSWSSAAEGKGFNAGVDIKEMQATEASTRSSARTGAASPRSLRCTSARCR